MSHTGPGPSENPFQSKTVRSICIISFKRTFVCRLLEKQLKHVSGTSGKQHWNNLWKVNESLEPTDVLLPPACAFCRYCGPARLSLKLCFFLTLRGGSSAPPFVVVYIFYYALSSFHTGPWITAHFEKIDIECQTFQALEKCIYPATCEPRVEVVVANVTVKGI